MKRSVEDRLGSIGAIVGAGTAYAIAHFRGIYLEQSAAALFGAAINVGAIAAGFLATCQSILLSASDSKVIQRMKNTEHFQRLLRFIANSIKCSFALAVLSTGLITLDFARRDGMHTIAVVVWAAIAGMTALSYYRSIGILLYILQSEESRASTTYPAVDEDILPAE